MTYRREHSHDEVSTASQCLAITTALARMHLASKGRRRRQLVAPLPSATGHFEIGTLQTTRKGPLSHSVVWLKPCLPSQIEIGGITALTLFHRWNGQKLVPRRFGNRRVNLNLFPFCIMSQRFTYPRGMRKTKSRRSYERHICSANKTRSEPYKAKSRNDFILFRIWHLRDVRCSEWRYLKAEISAAHMCLECTAHNRSAKQETYPGQPSHGEVPGRLYRHSPRFVGQHPRTFSNNNGDNNDGHTHNNVNYIFHLNLRRTPAP